MVIGRRNVVRGCCGVIGLALTPGIAHARDRFPRTCGLAHGASVVEGPDLQLTPIPDTLGVSIAIARYQQLFGAPAAALLMRGDASPNNAFAQWDSVDEPNRVLVGEKLVNQFRRVLDDWWRVALAGVLCHEYAHLYQSVHYPELVAPDVPSKVAELHADFLAGYALSFSKREDNIQIGAFASELYGLGDTNFTDPDHHGTPEERRAAMVEGYKAGIQPAAPPPIAQAAAAGLVWIRALPRAG